LFVEERYDEICGEYEGLGACEDDVVEPVEDRTESSEGREDEEGVSSHIARKSFPAGFGEVSNEEVEINRRAVGERM